MIKTKRENVKLTTPFYFLPDYNFRSYFSRRVREEFVKSRTIQGDDLSEAMKRGYEQLDLLQRQSKMNAWYQRGSSVMDGAN